MTTATSPVDQSRTATEPQKPLSITPGMTGLAMYGTSGVRGTVRAVSGDRAMIEPLDPADTEGGEWFVTTLDELTIDAMQHIATAPQGDSAYIHIRPGMTVQGFDGDRDVKGSVVRVVPEGIVIRRAESERATGSPDVFLAGWSDGITFEDAPDLTTTVAVPPVKAGDAVQYDHPGGIDHVKVIESHPGYCVIPCNGHDEANPEFEKGSPIRVCWDRILIPASRIMDHVGGANVSATIHSDAEPSPSKDAIMRHLLTTPDTLGWLRLRRGMQCNGVALADCVDGTIKEALPLGLILESVEDGSKGLSFIAEWSKGISFDDVGPDDLIVFDEPGEDAPSSSTGWPATDNPFTKLRRMLYDFNTARYATQEIVKDDKVAWGELDDMDKPVSLDDMMDTLTHLADRYDKRVATGLLTG